MLAKASSMYFLACESDMRDVDQDKVDPIVFEIRFKGEILHLVCDVAFMSFFAQDVRVVRRLSDTP